jgi:hypothetical protein
MARRRRAQGKANSKIYIRKSAGRVHALYDALYDITQADPARGRGTVRKEVALAPPLFGRRPASGLKTLITSLRALSSAPVWCYLGGASLCVRSKSTTRSSAAVSCGFVRVLHATSAPQLCARACACAACFARA